MPRPQLNILQMVSAPTTSGPGVHVLELSQQLRRLGHQVTIVARPGSWVADQAERLQFDLILSHQNRVPPNEILRLGREIVRRKIDVLHTHMSRAHVMGVLLRYWCSVPCIATAHNQKMQLHWPFNDRVVATSYSTQRFQNWFNAVPRRKLQTIYCPLRSQQRPIAFRNLQRVRRQFGDRDPANPRKLIGVVGEISYQKGHRFLVDAFAKVHAQDPTTRLVVVGNNRESYVNQMRQRAEALGVGEHICWAGYRGDIEQVMHALDLYVCPSLRESLPLTVLEAMAAGRPIVSTHVGGLPEIIKDRQTGWVVPVKNADAIADGVLQLLSQPGLAVRMGQQARQLTQNEFDHQQQTSKIEQLYLEVTGAGTERDRRRFQRRTLPDVGSTLPATNQRPGTISDNRSDLPLPLASDLPKVA